MVKDTMARPSDREIGFQARPADDELVRRIGGGDTAAFELLMRRYNRRLFRIARSILRDPLEAEDAVQEAYLRAYASLGSFKGPLGFSSWICRIVTNEALGRLRQRMRVVSLDDYRNPRHEQPRGSEALATMQPNPERLAVSSELRRALEHAIDTLPAEFAAVFMLRAVEGLSTAETSESLGIRPETVKTRFHRARKLLRKQLAGHFEQIVPTAFEFAGERCDRIVATVLARTAQRVSSPLEPPTITEPKGEADDS
jgi:RNA polymerase sigma-70 factor (ECF subfamily)